MSANAHRLGWIGMGRMGYPMAERLLKAGHDLSIWNRTRAKAEPLAGQGRQRWSTGRPISPTSTSCSPWSRPARTSSRSISATTAWSPAATVRCRGSSSTAPRSGSTSRRRSGSGSAGRGAALIAAPVSGNGKCVKAGKLSAVASGPEPAYREIEPLSRGDRRPRRVLCRRGRARAHLQDRAQRHAGRGHPEPGRDHDSDAEGRRAAPRLSGLHQQERDGLDLHPLQVAGPGQSRLDHDLHAGAAAQGPRPRPRRTRASSRSPMPVAAAAREALQAHFGVAQPAEPIPTPICSKDFAALLETGGAAGRDQRSRARTSRSTTASIARIRNETCVIEECKAAERAATPGKAAETAAGHAAWSSTGHAHGLRAKPVFPRYGPEATSSTAANAAFHAAAPSSPAAAAPAALQNRTLDRTCPRGSPQRCRATTARAVRSC